MAARLIDELTFDEISNEIRIIEGRPVGEWTLKDVERHRALKAASEGIGVAFGNSPDYSRLSDDELRTFDELCHKASRKGPA